MAEKARPLKTFPPRGPMRHWHTVGLDIPRQVARLQSLTPLLQATVILPWRKRRHQDRERDSGCIPGSDMAHCDAAGVNGATAYFSWGSASADDAEWMSG